MLRLQRLRDKLKKKRAALKEKRAALQKARENKRALKKRQDELEQQIEEAVADNLDELQIEVDEVVETIETTEDTVAELGDDVTVLAEEVQALVEEIQAVEEELGMEPMTDPVEEPAGEETNSRRSRAGLSTIGMARRGLLRHVPPQVVTRTMADPAVKEFMLRVRSMMGQSRAVTGAELTIPIVMLDILRDNLHRYSKLIGLVNLQPVPGVARQTIVGNIPEGVWTEMCADLNELPIVFNQIEVDGYKVGGFIPVCNAVLTDSDLDLASQILDMIGQAIGFALDKAIAYGTRQKMPLGFITRLAQTAQPSDWGINAPAWTDLHTSNIITLDPTGKTSEEFFSEIVMAAANAKANYAATAEKFWIMNEQTRAMLMAKTITFSAPGALVASENDTFPVIGGKIVEEPFMKDGDIGGGYGSLYLLAEREGAQFAQSEHVFFIQDQTVFKGTARYDGMPSFGEGFVLFNINNVAPTTTIPFAPDTANPATP